MPLAHEPTFPTTGPRLVSTGGLSLPLRGAALRVDTRGGLARVVLSQRFENPHAETLAVTYRMPLPADGAVSGYAFRIGERCIVGEVDRRAAARERFEQAIAEGRRAAILEQERSSLFTQEIHGIPPGAALVAELVVDQRLAWLDEGAWEWRFPTAAAPRYLGAPGAVADPGSVTLDVAGTPLPGRFSLELAIRDAVVQGRRPESPSHPLACSLAGGTQRVSRASEEAPLDRDVVVRWAVAQPAAGVVLDLARPAAGAPPRGEPDAAYALVTLVPPEPARRPVPVARDLVLLLDRSGSMAGEPLAQAQRVCAALVEGLGDADSVEVLAFASNVTRFAPEPVRASAEAKRRVLAWIASQQAGGGTEMRSGIVAALAAVRPEAQRQVIVVSDGLIGFEQETVADVIASLPGASRLHTVGIGPAVNRSFTAAAARAGRGVEAIVGLGEDAERAARRLLARTAAPIVVDLEVSGDAVLACSPSRLPDLVAGAPAMVSVRIRAGGGMIVVRGRTADGGWEQRVRVPPTAAGEGNPGVMAAFGREAVEDAEMRRCAGEAAAVVDRIVEGLGLGFQIATRLTSWVAVDTEVTVDPQAPVRAVRVPQQLPEGLSAAALGLRAPVPRPAPPRFDAVAKLLTMEPMVLHQQASRPAPESFDEKTRVTQVVLPPVDRYVAPDNDCLVVIHTKEPTLLGKRFVLGQSPYTIGRGAQADIVLDGDSVSRRHAHLERRYGGWALVDDGSTNGTYCNDERISGKVVLKRGDRIKIGHTIFKFLSGDDVEAQYHEEIYRMTILDGLTQIHNKRYLMEALQREILRARRDAHGLAFVLFDIDHFKQVNDTHGHLAGDFVLRELARIMQAGVRRNEILARYGGEELAFVLPEVPLADAVALAETMRLAVSRHCFVFEAVAIEVTVSAGVALLGDGDRDPEDLVRRADERLYEAKGRGRDRVCS